MRSCLSPWRSAGSRQGKSCTAGGRSKLKQYQDTIGHLPEPNQRRFISRIANVYGTTAGLLVILIIASSGIVLAPFAMALIARAHQNWVLLGNIGQAYGGVSALISAIALVGVVGSLLIQARQHSLDRLMQLRG